MAYTVTQKPNYSTAGFVGAYDPLIFVVLDTAATTYTNYRYVCKLTITRTTGAVVLDPVKVYPNFSNAAVFEVQTILQSYLSHDTQGDSTDLFSTQEPAEIAIDAIVSVQAQFGWTYTLNNIEQTIVYVSTETFYCINGRFTDPYINRLSSSNYTYNTQNQQGKFLSNVREQYTDTKTRMVLAFVNNVMPAGGDEVYSVEYKTYDSSDTLLNTYLIDISAYAYTTAGVAHKLIYVPAGAYNLPSVSLVNVDYYTIQLTNSTGLVKHSEVYTIHVIDDCSNKASVLVYSNALGGWDSIVMDGNTVESDSVEYKHYESLPFNYSTVNGSTIPVTYSGIEGGRTTYYGKSTRELTLYTTIRSEAITNQMNELMASHRVYYFDGAYMIPCNINSTSITYKSLLANERPQYEIKLSYAVDKQVVV